MVTYKVSRKLQEQSGSYFVTLPKNWVESLGLEQGDYMSLLYNGIVQVIPPEKALELREKEVK
jgi:phosphate uptake regulator